MIKNIKYLLLPLLLTLLTLPNITTAESSSCLSLNHNLMIGISKDTDTEGEVSSLQSFLQSIGTFNNSPTGYFGKYTKQAVKDFQAKSYNNISADDIDSTLVPSLVNREWLAQNNFSINKTGYVGSFTRAKIKYVSCHKLNTATASNSSEGGDLCTSYGLPNTIMVPKSGNTSKYLSMPKDGAYVFTFTAGATGTSGSSNTNYTNANQYMTISKSKCDFSPTLPSVCGKQGSPTAFIRWKVGGTADGIQCVLEPNTPYFVNVRDANLSGDIYTSTCPNGGCQFKIY